MVLLVIKTKMLQKRYYVNLKGHKNCIIGSKVTANEWILSIGGVASGRVGLRLQPAQQACFDLIIDCDIPWILKGA